MIGIVRHLGIEETPALCWKCGAMPGDGDWQGAHYLQRAHVIDRIFDGLDNAANLRPLCVTCHRLQPIFQAGQEVEALAWFNDRRDPLVTLIGEIIQRQSVG